MPDPGDRPASRVVRCSHYRWDVPTEEYKTDATHFRGVRRQTLLGEGEGEESLGFVTRYFEVEPGGYTSLERHRHPHCVVVIRGRGDVVLDDRVERIRAHDCIYVAPDAFHQFHAVGPEPLGFICVVDRERDRPQLPDGEELGRLRSRPAVARRIEI